MDVAIEASWKEILKTEFNQPYFEQIRNHLKTEKLQGKIIYPPGRFIFNAFDTTPFDEVKVVILGQDPYHGPKQAHGLCFSVPEGVPPPPSLVNIFKELQEDVGMPTPNHGNLTSWARQGVFLLNASLTVRAGEPSSHSKPDGHPLLMLLSGKSLPQEKMWSFFYGGNSLRKKERWWMNPTIAFFVPHIHRRYQHMQVSLVAATFRKRMNG